VGIAVRDRGEGKRNQDSKFRNSPGGYGNLRQKKKRGVNENGRGGGNDLLWGYPKDGGFPIPNEGAARKLWRETLSWQYKIKSPEIAKTVIGKGGILNVRRLEVKFTNKNGLLCYSKYTRGKEQERRKNREGGGERKNERVGKHTL